jgi:hypothetical protein
LDSRILDYLFWLKFAWSVWSEIREGRRSITGLVDRALETLPERLTEN